jgi:hypothetical protein
MSSTTVVSVPRAAREKRWVLDAVEVFAAVGAWYGGIGLIADNSIGMLPEWLQGTGFDSWTWPGIFLLIVVALPMTVAAAAEATRAAWAYRASLLAGAALVGWIVAQWVIFQRYFFLQPLMLTTGVLVIGLAWWTHRTREDEQ